MRKEETESRNSPSVTGLLTNNGKPTRKPNQRESRQPNQIIHAVNLMENKAPGEDEQHWNQERC